MQGGLHGALRREHIVVPLLISSPLLDKEKAQELFESLGRYPRTVDIYPTMLKILGLELPEKIYFERTSKQKLERQSRPT